MEKNAIHCSESNREAKEELKTLFPDFQAPKASPSAQLRDDLEQIEFKVSRFFGGLAVSIFQDIFSSEIELAKLTILYPF